MSIFLELSLIIVFATLIAVFMKMLRQPLVVGYIATGIIVGPYIFNVLQSVEYLELFSKIGIAVLLFIIGLNLNPDSMREVGKVSLIVGLGQVIFTAIIGFFIAGMLGFGVVASLYISIALTFSSTIIILKLLSDKGDLQKLYSKISIGILLTQDFVATILLLVVSVIGSSVTGGGVGEQFMFLTIRGFAIAIILYLISKYILPKFSSFLASSQELLFLFSLSWGLGLASLFYALGFSLEIGALIAGVTLSVSPFSYEIISRMKSLRDFFIVLFFVLLGSELNFTNIDQLLSTAVWLSLFVLIGNPLIVFVLLNLMGYKNRTGFQTGLTLAQISEFSLILIALGYGLGHIGREVVTLVTLVGIITIAVSSYFIIYSGSIYKKLAWLARIFEFRKHHKRELGSSGDKFDMVIFGYDRVGADFVNAAKKIASNYVVVDFNPDAIKRLQQENIPFKYGDAEDTEFLQDINLSGAKLVVSTIPDFEPNISLVKSYRKHNSSGIVIVLCHQVHQAKTLYLHGASYVVMPHHLGGHHASHMIEKYAYDAEEFERERNLHLARLAKQRS